MGKLLNIYTKWLGTRPKGKMRLLFIFLHLKLKSLTNIWNFSLPETSEKVRKPEKIVESETLNDAF